VTTTKRAAAFDQGTVYRATPESVGPHIHSSMRTAMVRNDLTGTPYVLVTRVSDTEIAALLPPRTPTAWTLATNFVDSDIVTRFPEWRGWGLGSGNAVEVIDGRGEIEEFRTRVHDAVTKEGTERGWCSEADEWLTQLGLPPRGTPLTISITGSKRASNGVTADQIRRDLLRALTNAGFPGLVVVVHEAAAPVDVAF